MTNAKLPNIEVMNIVKFDKLTKQQTWGGGDPNHILKLFWKKEDHKILLKNFKRNSTIGWDTHTHVQEP
jgi:hypothetical protein